MSDMTDEELGRAWCSANGRRPKVYADGRAKWLPPYWCGAFEFNAYPDWLSPIVSVVVREANPDGEFADEAAAYAAVGAALRQIRQHAEVRSE